MLIDAHVHVWALRRGDYGWLRRDDPLHRDFSVQDYADANECCSIDGANASERCAIDGIVLVQAAPTLAETRWLLDIARQEPLVLGVVGWVDFDDPAAPELLPGVAADGLVAVRPMLQDIADPAWMLNGRFDRLYDRLSASDIVFDALVRPLHLRVVEMLARRHPGLPIVLDHLGKPDIAGRAWQPWADDIAALAALPNVFCKLSGLTTQSAPADDHRLLAPYVAHALSCFTPARLIWGSDWPVVTTRTTVAAWHDMTLEMLAPLDRVARDAIHGGNAARIYRLTAGETS